MYQQTELQQKKLVKNSGLDEFKKKHSETFIYFLEEYEKWQELKKKTVTVH